MAKDNVSAQTQSAADSEIERLRKTVAEQAAELANLRIPRGNAVRVTMRMARNIDGKPWARGHCIGEFIPAEGVTLAEAELAIRSHKTAFGDVPADKKDERAK